MYLGEKCFRQGDSLCKGPEVGSSLACSRNGKEATIARAELATGETGQRWGWSCVREQITGDQADHPKDADIHSEWNKKVL